MSSRKKIYLYSAILGIISLFFLFLAIPFFLGKVKKNSESLLFLKQELVSLQGEIENLQILKVIHQNRKDDLERIDDFFVDSEVPIQFIDFLEMNAEATQQKIDIALIPSKKEKDEIWLSLFFQISTSGSSSDFLKFLEKLENSLYLIEVMNLNTKKLTKGEFFPPFSQDFSVGSVESAFLIKVFAKND